jgi:epoxyqueuosine reductase
VDGSKCISYFTIELKDQMPASLQADFQSWIFGCDICQDVCPWNRFSNPHNEPRFDTNLQEVDWEGLSEDLFNELFRYSAINRTKLKGIKRNIAHIKKMEP